MGGPGAGPVRGRVPVSISVVGTWPGVPVLAQSMHTLLQAPTTSTTTSTPPCPPHPPMLLQQQPPFIENGTNSGKNHPDTALSVATLYWPVQAGLEALLDLLLGAQVVGVPALLLAAVDSAGVQAGVAPGGDRSAEPRVPGEGLWELGACRKGVRGHGEGTQGRTCGRSSCRSCISGPAGAGKAR